MTTAAVPDGDAAEIGRTIAKQPLRSPSNALVAVGWARLPAASGGAYILSTKPAVCGDDAYLQADSATAAPQPSRRWARTSWAAETMASASRPWRR